MSQNISSENAEIIEEFIQESRDMVDQLEPAIIALGQRCQNLDCWEVLDCTDRDCPRHGVRPPAPCWLHTGFVGDGSQRCIFARSEQDCRACDVFRSINGDDETINAIFRLFHSMKGSAGFLELNQIARVAHAGENLLDLIRSGKIRLHPDHVDLLCHACDFAKEAMAYVADHFNDQGMEARAATVSDRLEAMIEKALVRSRDIRTAFPDEEKLPDLQQLITPELVGRFCQEADELIQNIEQGLLKWAESTADIETITGLFRDIHSFKGNCGFLGYGDQERLAHQMETVLEIAKSGGELAGGQPAELLLELVDVLRGSLADVSRGGPGLVEDLERHLSRLRQLVPAEKVDRGEAAEKTAVAPGKCENPRPSKEVRGAGKSTSAEIRRQDIRVDLEKLDNLINLIGELVIAENMLIHSPDLLGRELESFHKAAQQMNKIVRELQEMAMIIRMIPVAGLFRRMIRLVHDLSVKSGKKVDLQLSGEETEVDKTVIEMITDPLVHLLRNALDHGLESPEERQRAGKPAKGMLRLAARHEEGEVWITVEDDGRGLNREKILARALSNGLVEGDGTGLNDRAVFSLIFQPGFSTADQVTDISGRGVGMDVVKQNLDKIKGRVEVTSKPGMGARIDLRIPLTLAIIEGMLVRMGQTKCIVPLLAIQEIFRPNPDAITVLPDGQLLARVREHFFPIKRLGGIAGEIAGPQRIEEGILIVLEHRDSCVCLLTDEILGQQQTVIKGLPEYIGNVRAASGCTILGDGEVCMILDVGSLVETGEPAEI